jgi:proline iminopeptidase
MLRRKQLVWLYQEGAGCFFPEAWEQYVEQIPKAEHGTGCSR